jgi:hypothetical protein
MPASQSAVPMMATKGGAAAVKCSVACEYCRLKKIKCTVPIIFSALIGPTYSYVSGIDGFLGDEAQPCKNCIVRTDGPSELKKILTVDMLRHMVETTNAITRLRG